MVLPIRDVARVFGVTAETIRLWEAKGVLPKASRTPFDQRRWDPVALIPLMRERSIPVPAEWLRSSEAAA